MTVTNSASRTIALGDSVTTTFSGNFQLPNSSSLTVWLEQSTGSTTLLTSNLYSLAGVGGQTGFTITYPLIGSPIVTGQSLILIRQVPNTQPTALTNQGPFDPTVVMTALDNLEFQIQQLNTQAGLSVRLPYTTNAINPFYSTASFVSGFMYFDTAGNPTTIASTTGLPSSIYTGLTGGATTLTTEMLFSGPVTYSLAGSIATVGFATVSGDATLSSTGLLTLVTTGVTTGTFLVSTVTVDAKGRITNIATGSLSGATIGVQDGVTTVTNATTVSFTAGSVSNAGGGVAQVNLGMTKIQTLTANNSASLAFTTGIGANFNVYFITFDSIFAASTGQDFQMQVSTNSGSSWIAGTSYVYSQMDQKFSTSIANTGSGGAAQVALANAVDSSANLGTNGEIWLHNLPNTASDKWGTWQSVNNSTADAATHHIRGGFVVALQTAINGIQLKAASGNITSGTATLYGLAK